MKKKTFESNLEYKTYMAKFMAPYSTRKCELIRFLNTNILDILITRKVIGFQTVREIV